MSKDGSKLLTIPPQFPQNLVSDLILTHWTARERTFLMAMNKNRLDQKKGTRSQINQKDSTQRTPEITWKFQKQRKIRDSLANSLLLRDYKEMKKISHPLWTIALKISLSFTHNLSFNTSLFIKKTRVTSCDIPKLPLTRGLSFLYREASKLDRIPLLCSLPEHASIWNPKLVHTRL